MCRYGIEGTSVRTQGDFPMSKRKLKRKTAASEVGSLGVGAAGIKSVGGWRTDQEANYYAQDADRRRINRMVVEQWDAELERQEAERATSARRAQIRRVK